MRNGGIMAVKVILAVLLIAIAGFIYLAIDHNQQQRAVDEQFRKAHEDAEALIDQTKQETFNLEVKYVRLTMGERDADLYKLCHTYAPTEKANQIKCKKLDSRVAARHKQDKPW